VVVAVGLAEDDFRSAKPKPPTPVEDISEEEYYELLRLLADTLDQVERNYVKEVTRRELVEAAIDGVISKLDQYSNYIPPDELDRFKSGVENEFGGIGIQVAIDQGKLTITSPIVDTPAYRAGLLAGDVITNIEGESAAGITLDGAVRRLKGKVGTKVTFTVRHAHNGEEETVTVERAMVQVESVLGDTRNDKHEWNWL
ncbi:MAG: PDZ domain-containing protein, partial [Planctomycetales bacterium]|nr:PDZ domain-containing protein [Planctomycetales bacterium]